MERVYLDNAATCLVQPRVLEKASEFVNMLRDTALSTGDVTRMQRSSLKTAREAVVGFLTRSKKLSDHP
jgi:cysteine sulfinate desulfinase/cysteine desulfurase-like protein